MNTDHMKQKHDCERQPGELAAIEFQTAVAAERKNVEHDSTTIIIRRRLRHAKTTICGIVTMITPFAILIWPQHALLFSSIMSVAAGAGLVSAADAKPGQGI